MPLKPVQIIETHFHTGKPTESAIKNVMDLLKAN